jgi:hypothetical protein
VWLLPITVISALLLYESFLLLLFVAAVEFFLSSEDDVTRKGATGAIAGKSPDHLIFGFAIGSSEKQDEQDVSVGVNFVSDDDDDDDDDDNGFVFVPMSKTKRTLCFVWEVSVSGDEKIALPLVFCNKNFCSSSVRVT